MKEYKPSVLGLRLLRACLLVMTALLCIAAALMPLPILMCAAVGICTAVWVWLGCFFRSLRCIVTSQRICVMRGVLWRKEQTIRRDAVQFVRRISGIRGERGALHFLRIYVYGGSILLPFLSRKDMEALCTLLEESHAP